MAMDINTPRNTNCKHYMKWIGWAFIPALACVALALSLFLMPHAEPVLASKGHDECAPFTNKLKKKLKKLEKKAANQTGTPSDAMTGRAAGACGAGALIHTISYDVPADLGVAFHNLGDCPVIVSIEQDSTGDTIPLVPGEKIDDFYSEVVKISFVCQSSTAGSCCAVGYSVVDSD